MFYEPNTRDRIALPHDPFKAIVAPRPIGWISTVSPAGDVNLAPFSFFQGGTSNPPTTASLVSSGQAATNYAPGTLTIGATYYWRIDANNPTGTTMGDVWSFTTGPPAPPTSPNPSNGAAGQSNRQAVAGAS